LEHSKFDVSNSSLPMLLIWRFERHDQIFYRSNLRDSRTTGPRLTSGG